MCHLGINSWPSFTLLIASSSPSFYYFYYLEMITLNKTAQNTISFFVKSKVNFTMQKNKNMWAPPRASTFALVYTLVKLKPRRCDSVMFSRRCTIENRAFSLSRSRSPSLPPCRWAGGRRAPARTAARTLLLLPPLDAQMSAAHSQQNKPDNINLQRRSSLPQHAAPLFMEGPGAWSVSVNHRYTRCSMSDRRIAQFSFLSK